MLHSLRSCWVRKKGWLHLSHPIPASLSTQSESQVLLHQSNCKNKPKFWALVNPSCLHLNLKKRIRRKEKRKKKKPQTDTTWFYHAVWDLGLGRIAFAAVVGKKEEEAKVVYIIKITLTHHVHETLLQLAGTGWSFPTKEIGLPDQHLPT